MLKIAVLDDYDGSISKLTCWQKLESSFELLFFKEPIQAKDVSSFDVIVANRERTILDQKFLSEALNLKHLALTGRLSGQADLASLKTKGVAVSFTDGSGQSATELTIALIMGLTKRLHDRHDAVRNGGWQIGPSLTLQGKTLGVLGLGRIGARVAEFGKLLGMNVVSWGPTEDNGRSDKMGVQRMSLSDCLQASDVLSINLRLSEKTRHLLGAKELSLLKNGGFLVNTSRAEIIEKDAFYSELKKGRICAALDVFYKEPLPEDDPIRKFQNVLLSPHMGYVTNEVYQIFFTQVVDNILAWKNGTAYKDALKV